jgi:hypothetical protein
VLLLPIFDAFSLMLLNWRLLWAGQTIGMNQRVRGSSHVAISRKILSAVSPGLSIQVSVRVLGHPMTQSAQIAARHALCRSSRWKASQCIAGSAMLSTGRSFDSFIPLVCDWWRGWDKCAQKRACHRWQSRAFDSLRRDAHVCMQKMQE